jgi:hypothetical protein
MCTEIHRYSCTYNYVFVYAVFIVCVEFHVAYMETKSCTLHRSSNRPVLSDIGSSAFFLFVPFLQSILSPPLCPATLNCVAQTPWVTWHCYPTAGAVAAVRLHVNQSARLLQEVKCTSRKLGVCSIVLRCCLALSQPASTLATREGQKWDTQRIPKIRQRICFLPGDVMRPQERFSPFTNTCHVMSRGQTNGRRTGNGAVCCEAQRGLSFRALGLVVTKYMHIPLHWAAGCVTTQSVCVFRRLPQ